MPVPAESIEAGKCYLVLARRPGRSGGVRRVVRIMPNGQIQFEHRTSSGRRAGWKAGILDLRSFAATLEREVSCDWTPEDDA